ncbi:unknown [Neodiprion lecontei nucleopolyhedrovirus]|uniref:Uncharacterized protein n=1 Tax=Neodiprion lecontei nucleopolyhedrovirus (strain Canada) TaxID=654906 RepID=Q6JPA7_NPVNC|nr:unknown [Neodiprion lecontei nucleopolyhedrovirus]AAQ99125.1 unknown [Neodiprion lecontei nucleopolyhedrovirus]
MTDAIDGLQVNLSYDQESKSCQLIKLMKIVIGGVMVLISFCGIAMIENLIIINVLSDGVVDAKNHAKFVEKFIHNATL